MGGQTSVALRLASPHTPPKQKLCSAHRERQPATSPPLPLRSGYRSPGCTACVRGMSCEDGTEMVRTGRTQSTEPRGDVGSCRHDEREAGGGRYSCCSRGSTSLAASHPSGFGVSGERRRSAPKMADASAGCLEPGDERHRASWPRACRHRRLRPPARPGRAQARGAQRPPCLSRGGQPVGIGEVEGGRDEPALVSKTSAALPASNTASRSATVSVVSKTLLQTTPDLGRHQAPPAVLHRA